MPFLKRNIIVSIILITALGIITGCSSSPLRKSTTSKSKQVQATSQVVDVDRLSQGGSLIIVPFTAGAGIEAIEETDRIALNIVKGLSETLGANNSQFEILQSDSSKETQLVIKGHITVIANPHGVKKWIGSKQSILGVDAHMIDAKTGNLVASFIEKEKFKRKEGDFNDAAIKIGHKIGQFIIDAGNSRENDG